MLEPLFRCNLACVGCGKIDYPDAILNRRMTAQECWDAADECGAPMVAIPGGEPLIHKEIGEIVRGLVERKKFVSLCTNALLLEKKLDLFEPSPYLFFSVHLDGLKDHHDKAVSQQGVFDRAVSAIKAAKARGFTVNVNATIFDGHPAEEIAKFLDFTTELGVGVSMSPGYAYERAPDQEHFLNRTKTKKLFRDVFALGKGKKWNFMHSGLFLDFLAGNQEYECTPWGMPARNIFGWQKPCYLLGEGYAKTFKELMETTDWDTYGTGKYEKCADCMAHCGYEPTAATAALNNPLKAMWVALRGIRTTGPMAPEIDLEQAAAGAVYLLGAGRRRSCPRSAATRRSPPRRRRRRRLPRPLKARRTRPQGNSQKRRRIRCWRSGLFRRPKPESALDARRDEALGAEQEAAAAAQRAQRAVEVDAGPNQRTQRPRVARDAAQDLAQVDFAVRLHCGLGEFRQRPVGGIADHPERSKGNACLGGIGCRDMAFHIDGGGTRYRAQRGLASLGGNHLLDAGQPALDDPPALQRGTGDHLLVQRGSGQEALLQSTSATSRTSSRRGSSRPGGSPRRCGAHRGKDRQPLDEVREVAEPGTSTRGRRAGRICYASRSRAQTVSGRTVPSRWTWSSILGCQAQCRA